MYDQMLPILKDTKDPHYRYKMPKITAKIEGSGNGIKTVLTNINQVAKSLGRPPSYLTKYFGCELGAQVTMASDIYTVNGSHDTDKLLNLLYSFIKRFVLCPKCSNPETVLSISNGAIKQKCLACGHGNLIAKNVHKLTTFIINNPPDGSDKKSESKKLAKKSKLSKSVEVEKKLETEEKEEDFDQDELTSDAYVSRLKEMTDGLKAEVYKTDHKESANQFFKLVSEKKETGCLLDSIVQKELLNEAERLGIREKCLLIFTELLFTENILEEIKTYRILLLRFCNENKKAQRYLLGGFEKLVADVYKDKLFDKSVNILKQFYDMDILEEEAIVEWSAKESKKYISKELSRKLHEKVSPFVKWLREAEVESDEEEEKSAVNEKKAMNEEDEEDDEFFEFSHRVQGLTIEKVESVRPINEDQGNDEDIDIDNI
ncbi:Eukaryotic translation initiation factor 5 [Brachionus plicatilis]|uniref:Eukaryotic translation initiation factor 5 n=1 Tax=Brachionus plicatilis TaxID=10195 RepID=A0A3M7T396_BRAPC|nr:Eukaryotic translation initiation factor 5 [Brachionus plicatilis]